MSWSDAFPKGTEVGDPKREYARPHDQRTDDDCLVCCLSYILGIDYEFIPNFVRDDGAMWSESLREWLDDRGLEIVSFDNHYPRKGMYLADGWTDRNTPHITVWRGVDMIHDPHVSKAGFNEYQAYLLAHAIEP